MLLSNEICLIISSKKRIKSIICFLQISLDAFFMYFFVWKLDFY